MKDERIIELFFERSERAIEALDLKYGRLCHNIAYNILCSLRDAEECVSDTYLAVWNVIPPERPYSLKAYVCKIVRNISLKLHRAKNADKRRGEYDISFEEISGCLQSDDNVEQAAEAKELVKIIEDFLDTLTEENRTIFIRRYWFFDSYKNIACAVGLSEKTVSVRLYRIREKMRGYLAEREVLI